MEEVRNAFSSLATTCVTIREAAEVPSTSLVCPSNWGSASRTVTTAVSPSNASSLTTSSSATLSNRCVRSASLTVLVTDRSNPETWVPPLGVAMMLTKDLSVVSYPVPQRSAMSTPNSRCTSVGIMCPRSSSTGTVSLKVPLPCSRSPSQTARSGARYSQNSLMPPS